MVPSSVCPTRRLHSGWELQLLTCSNKNTDQTVYHLDFRCLVPSLFLLNSHSHDNCNQRVSEFITARTSPMPHHEMCSHGCTLAATCHCFLCASSAHKFEPRATTPSVSETAGAREASVVEAIVPCHQPIVALDADCGYSCNRHNVDAYPACFVGFHPGTYTSLSSPLPCRY